MYFFCIPHHLYSPDLPLSDYPELFEPVMEALVGKKFSTDIEVKTAVSEWLCSLLKDYFYGIEDFMYHWYTYIECKGH